VGTEKAESSNDLRKVESSNEVLLQESSALTCFWTTIGIQVWTKCDRTKSLTSDITKDGQIFLHFCFLDYCSR